MLLWIFQIVFLNDFYKFIKIHQLKAYAQYLSVNIDNITFDSSDEDSYSSEYGIGVKSNFIVELPNEAIPIPARCNKLLVAEPTF